MSRGLSECRGCGQPVKWLKTIRGKNIPVDPDTIDDQGATVFDQDQGMVSHFATCPKSDELRRPKEPRR